MATLVLGIGNTLLGDEGVGVHAVRALADRLAGDDRVCCLDGGTLSFTLAGPIETHDALIVIDAARLDAAPGAVRVFEGAELDAFLGAAGRRSVHEVGLIDLIAIARLAGRLPVRRALVGVQPDHVGWAEDLTDPVAQSLPRVQAEVLGLIERWRA